VNNYEALCIIKPDLKDVDIANACKAIVEVLTKQNAVVKKEEPWGKRQLAYRMKKSRDGIYFKVEFQASPDSIAKVRELYALNPEILRVMITKR